MSQERRSQLVDDIVETQPRLANFVRTRSGDLIAGSWDLLSYSFQSGFELMWDHAYAQTSGVLTRPLLSLWRQSVELALKSAIRRPSSLTMVLTDWIAAAEGVISSTRGMQASLKGMETAQPRTPSARTPPIAAGRSVVVKAL
jgi:hypothetical protein